MKGDFSIQTETDNVKYLCEIIFKSLKDFEIGNIKIFDKISGYLDFINFSLGSKIKLEYDPKVLVEEYVKKRGVNERVNISQYIFMFVCGLVCFVSQNEQRKERKLIEAIKAINFDVVQIVLGDQRYQNGYALSIKIPGLTKCIEENILKIWGK